MADQIAKGVYFERKADKKLSGWGLFSSKYDDAVDFYQKAASSFKVAKSWDKAALVNIKLAGCHLKLDSKHESASAYVDAGNCYKKTSTNKAISCLDQAVNIFLDIHRLHMAARKMSETSHAANFVLQCTQDIGELYEQTESIEQAIVYFERAADLFHTEEITTSVNLCNQKVAQFSAQLGNYLKAIDLYEEVARESLNSNLLKYGVRGHLLNAGLCELCRGDVVAITNALEKYEDLDPSFSRTREYRFLADLAAAVEEEDVAKFVYVVKEFDSITHLDPWKTTLLSRVKKALKDKEMEEDLT